jgi:hypothetical protein
VLAAAGFCIVSILRPPDVADRFKPHQQAVVRADADFLQDNPLLREMIHYAPQTRWAVTDLPICAFRAGLPVPPELAVSAEKHMQTGFLTETQVLDAIDGYRPEQMLLGPFEYERLGRILAERYQLVVERGPGKPYVREDLASQAE